MNKNGPNRIKASYVAAEKSAWLGIWVNLSLFTVKIIAGVVGKSQAMIADAFHTASDAFTSLGVLFGFKIAKRPPDEHHPFGHGRAESIVAKLMALVLVGVGIAVAFRSASVLISGSADKPANIALFAALLSILVKEIVYRKVVKTANTIRSISLEADAWHHRSDALSSIAALVGIAGAKMGWSYMDPMAGMIVAGFIVKAGANAFHKAYDELMDAAPSEKVKNEVIAAVIGIEEVREVRKVRARKSGIEIFFEITIGVDGEKTVKEGHTATIRIKREISKKIPNVKDVIVHVEPC